MMEVERLVDVVPTPTDRLVLTLVTLANDVVTLVRILLEVSTMMPVVVPKMLDSTLLRLDRKLLRELATELAIVGSMLEVGMIEVTTLLMTDVALLS